MIRKVWNNGHVLWQIAPEDTGIAEQAIVAHVDNGGTLCLEQEENCITVNWESVPELIHLLKGLAKQRTT